MKKFGFLLVIISFGLEPNLQAQINSVLSSGTWYKFAVTESSIYEIKGSDLESAGISISTIAPSKLRLFGSAGGILPQANNAKRPVDLEEMAILVLGSEDGQFNSNDKIIFWGEGPNKVAFDSEEVAFQYEKNIYSDTSYYFLNIEQSIGKRIENSALIEGSYPEVNRYLSHFVHELEEINLLRSGRTWYGEKFDSDIDQSFTTDFSNWINGSEVKIRSSVMASSFAESSFDVSINGTVVGNHPLQSIPDSRYAIKGYNSTELFTTILPENSNSNLEVNYTFNKQNGTGYLNYFLVQVEKSIAVNNSFVELIIPKKSDLISTLKANISSSNSQLWNISNFNSIKNINSIITDNQLSANINTDTTAHLVLIDLAGSFQVPQYVKQITNQNLHGISNINLLIITAPDFFNQANELKNHKQSQGISAKVVLTSQVYNEFSAGRRDITAIRDFTKYLYENAGLEHLLLFGKGTYDYKNYDGQNNSFVPIYESRNSLSPLYSYGSDDYLGFMDSDEGEWKENASGDHTMDIGVGRLPVKSVEDAVATVDKIKRYHSKIAIGDWRKKISFVAENGDFNIHQRDAERLSTLIDTSYSAFNPQKIYIDAYPIEALPGGTKAPLVNQAILDIFDQGSLIINYTGHGNREQWAKSNVFNRDMIKTLENDIIFPLVVTATCEFGQHDNGYVISAGEELVVMPNAGAIGLITTSRPVFASSNYKLNLAFYNTVLATKKGVYKSIGEIFLDTKNNSLSGPNNRNFSLLADPSLKLSYPEEFIQLDSLNGNSLSTKDTITALEHVTFSGSLRGTTGMILTNYNGEIEINFYDRPTTKQTLGNFGTPFIYNDRDNLLFSGSSTVKNGIFKFQFTTPLDISYQIMEGKISMYAVANDSTDANGANVSIKIGGTNSNPISDNTPPTIDVFMEDSTFINNSLVSSNSLLIAYLFDENGINLSKSQVGHNITYSIDGEEPISLNDYFQYDIDSYQSGKLHFPLQGLTPGSHSIVVKGWDTFNNPSETEILFNVATEQEVYISEVSVYPNPVQNEAYFTFKHNLSGNDVTVLLKILNRSGQIVYTKEIEYTNASALINNIEWDGRNATGQKLTEGLYIYSINIRSVSSGATNTFFGRLMTLN